MSRIKLATAMLVSAGFGSALASADICEAGWHMDNTRQSRPKPRSKSKSTHKQNARKARKG